MKNLNLFYTSDFVFDENLRDYYDAFSIIVDCYLFYDRAVDFISRALLKSPDYWHHDRLSF